MKNYDIVIRVPVKAGDDKAARAAQLKVYHQVQLALSRGIKRLDFEVGELSHEQFTTVTSVERRD